MVSSVTESDTLRADERLVCLLQQDDEGDFTGRLVD